MLSNKRLVSLTSLISNLNSALIVFDNEVASPPAPCIPHHTHAHCRQTLWDLQHLIFYRQCLNFK